MTTGNMIFIVHAQFNNPLTIEMVHEVVKDGQAELDDFRQVGNYYLYNWESKKPLPYGMQ